MVKVSYKFVLIFRLLRSSTMDNESKGGAHDWTSELISCLKKTYQFTFDTELTTIGPDTVVIFTFDPKKL